jgi:hypothetical protein
MTFILRCVKPLKFISKLYIPESKKKKWCHLCHVGVVGLQILSRPLLQVVIPAGQAQVRLVNLGMAKVSLETTVKFTVYKVQTPSPHKQSDRYTVYQRWANTLT